MRLKVAFLTRNAAIADNPILYEQNSFRL